MLEIWEMQTISPISSLFVTQRPFTYSQGNMGRFWGDEAEWGNSSVLEHKSVNNSETRKDRGKVTMDGL